MSPQTNRNILIGMAAGVVLGAVAGAVIPEAMLLFGVVGRLFVNALQILLLPLIPAVIIAGVAGLGHASKLGRAAVSTVLYFVATTAIAVVIGTVLVLLFNPGGSATPGGAFIPDMVARARATSVADIFAAFIPENLINSIGSGQYLGLVVFSLVFGAVICAMGARAKVVVDFFKAIADITLHIATYILYAAPIGLFVLVGSAVARNPEGISQVGGNLLWLTVTFLLAILLHGLVVLPLMLRFLGHRSPIEYVGKVMPALMTAFGTASSAAALPVTFRNVVDDSDVDARAGSLVLPLGVSMNANGTAIYLVIAAVFTAQMFGLSLSIFQVIAIALLSVLLSLGTAGAPGMALFSLTILFATLQFPVEAYGVIGLLVVVDWLFDRGRALLNAWGDMVGAAIIGESFEFKTARVTRTVTESPMHRRDHAPERRDRRSSEGEARRGPRDATRERTPRGRGRTSERPARPERSTAERPSRPPQEVKPAEPRRDREVEARREAPAPVPARAAAPERDSSRRGEGRGGPRRGRDSERPPRGERTDRPGRGDRRERTERGERTEQMEPKVQQPPAGVNEEAPVVEERTRIMPPPIPPRPERESAAAPEREAQPEPPRPMTEPERTELPEIRRRPLPAERPSESTPEPERESSSPAEFAAPREQEVRPEPPQLREERDRPREPRWQRPEPEAERPTESASEKTEREPFERREEPSLRDLLTNLSASRENRPEPEARPERGASEQEKPADEEPRREQPVSFGRSKSRHGVRPGGQPTGGGEPEPSPQSETPVERKEDFPAEGVTSFGRSRRRKGH